MYCYEKWGDSFEVPTDTSSIIEDVLQGALE